MMIKFISNNIVLVVTLLLGIYFANSNVEYRPSVVFMDVGQGDAILILDSSGRKILIDGGDGDYVVYLLAKYLHPNDRFFDVLILTHPHQDHMSGLVDVIERYEVGQVYYYPVCYSSQLYKHFLDLEVEIVAVEPGYVFQGDSFSMEVLYPLQDYDRSVCLNYSNINNASIVTRLVSDSGSILFMGDAEHEQEEILLKNYRREDMEADILKAGHHCSRTASSASFLEYIGSKYVVCSVGLDNRFGHPHDEVIDIFQKLGVNFGLTFQEGDIVFEI